MIKDIIGFLILSLFIGFAGAVIVFIILWLLGTFLERLVTPNQ